MNRAELNQLAGTWAAYAAYYRSKLEDEVLKMYAEDLADLPFNDVVRAMQDYRKNPRNRFMPMPADIRTILTPEIDPESAAREIASRIGYAIVKYGWNNASSAEEYIGRVGWAIVQRSGGWSYLCQHHGLSIDPGVFAAQAREIAKSDLTQDPRKLAEVIGLGRAPEPPVVQIDHSSKPQTKRPYLVKKAEEFATDASRGGQHAKAQLNEILKAVKVLDQKPK